MGDGISPGEDARLGYSRVPPVQKWWIDTLEDASFFWRRIQMRLAYGFFKNLAFWRRRILGILR
jgi:hypothetical protein